MQRRGRATSPRTTQTTPIPPPGLSRSSQRRIVATGSARSAATRSGNSLLSVSRVWHSSSPHRGSAAAIGGGGVGLVGLVIYVLVSVLGGGGSGLDPSLLFPADGITKGEMAQYYRRVAPLMVPHIARRPLTLGKGMPWTSRPIRWRANWRCRH